MCMANTVCGLTSRLRLGAGGREKTSAENASKVLQGPDQKLVATKEPSIAEEGGMRCVARSEAVC
jgi:hypothetical protein